jgi:ABC-type amino acid transport substrate-binding protein
MLFVYLEELVMIQRLLALSLLSISLLVNSLLVFAENSVVSAVCDPWPKFTEPDSNKQGLVIELIREALLTQSLDIDVDFIPWSHALMSLQQGQTDVLIGAWKAEERDSYLIYSDSIYSAVNEPLAGKDIYLAANRGIPEYLELITAFNTGLAQLKSNGQYEKIISSYYLD